MEGGEKVRGVQWNLRPIRDPPRQGRPLYKVYLLQPHADTLCAFRDRDDLSTRDKIIGLIVSLVRRLKCITTNEKEEEREREGGKWREEDEEGRKGTFSFPKSSRLWMLCSCSVLSILRAPSLHSVTSCL